MDEGTRSQAETATGSQTAPTSVVAPPTTQPLAPPRTLRQRIDDHPAALFVGIAIAAATATLGIVLPIVQLTQDSRVASVQAELDRYRSEQQLVIDGLRADLDQARRESAAAVAQEREKARSRIEELERSLSGINRSLGADTDFYDVSDLVIEPRDASAIPATSAYDATDRFYALDPAKTQGWTTEVTTELRLVAEAYGLTEDQVRAQLTPLGADAWTRFPLHVWRYGDDLEVRIDDPTSDTDLVLHPRTQAVVQRVSHADYIELQLEGLPVGSAGIEPILRAGFIRDPTGWVLQDQLLADIASSGSLRPRVESLQKRDDIAYGRVEAVLPDVTIGDLAMAEYYWTREWLIVDAGSDLYLVKLFVADDDHRSPDYAAISSWLDGLRIVRS
jgi:hypothetical protein